MRHRAGAHDIASTLNMLQPPLGRRQPATGTFRWVQEQDDSGDCLKRESTGRSVKNGCHWSCLGRNC